MKKLFFIACCALAGVVAANAQWYVGGSIAFRETSSISETVVDYRNGQAWQTDSEISPVRTSFGIIPRVGYMFNDRWSAGIALGYEFVKESPYSGAGDKAHMHGFSVQPFVRCNVLWFGPFSLALEGKGLYARQDIREDIYKDAERESNVARRFGGEIAPVLILDASRRLSLECRLDFLAFGYYHTRQIRIVKEDDLSSRRKHSSNNAFAAFSGDDVFTLGNLTFGMVYKF